MAKWHLIFKSMKPLSSPLMEVQAGADQNPENVKQEFESGLLLSNFLSLTPTFSFLFLDLCTLFHRRKSSNEWYVVQITDHWFYKKTPTQKVFLPPRIVIFCYWLLSQTVSG